MAIQITKVSNKYKARVWCSDVFGERRSAQCSNFDSRRAAENWADAALERLSDGLECYDGNILFRDLDEKYYNERKVKVSPTTLHTTFGIIRQTVLEYMRDIKAKNVSTSVVQEFVDDRQTKGAKKKTAKNYVSYIKAVINWGVAHDYLEHNRIKKISYIEDDEDYEPRPLTLNEVAMLLVDFRRNCYSLYIATLTTILTSARRGEVLGLTWDNIDFDSNTISFHKQLISIKGQPIEKVKLKTKSSRRTVPLCNFLKEELLEHKEKFADPDDDHICSNIFQGRITPDYLSSKLHDYVLGQFGIDMREHDLRHTFSQLFVELADELLRIKSELMGHSDIVITRDVYTRPDHIKKKALLDKIGELLKQTMCAIECANNQAKTKKI